MEKKNNRTNGEITVKRNEYSNGRQFSIKRLNRETIDMKISKTNSKAIRNCDKCLINNHLNINLTSQNCILV